MLEYQKPYPGNSLLVIVCDFLKEGGCSAKEAYIRGEGVRIAESSSIKPCALDQKRECPFGTGKLMYKQ